MTFRNVPRIMRTIAPASLIFYFLLSLVAPLGVAHATSTDPTRGSLNLVPCGRVWDGDAQKWVEDPCEFSDLTELFENVIVAFFYFLVILMGFLIIRTGFVYLNSRGNPVKLAYAKKSFWHLGIGILIMLAAWGIYKFALDQILKPEYQPLSNEAAE